MTNKTKAVFATVFVAVIGVSAAMALGPTSGQITGGGGLTRVVTNDARLTGSGTSGNPLAVDMAGTAGRITGTGSAGSRFDLATTAVTPGTCTNCTVTFDGFGRATAQSSGTAGVPSSRQIIAGTGLSGGGDLSADRTLNLANTAVSPGSYTHTSLTVDAQGRLTAASSGTPLAASGNFGDGSDGAAVFDGAGSVTGFSRSGSTYTATRSDVFFTTVTISNGVVIDMAQSGAVGSGRFFSNSGITLSSGTATIRLNGLNASGATAGAALGTGHTGAVSGAGSGGIQNAGQNAGNFSGNWCNSFRAGVGGFGGPSATNAGSTTASQASTLLADSIGCINSGWDQAKQGRINLANPGALSGGGGGGSGGGTTGVCSGGGGGGGGGLLVVGMRQFTGAGTLNITTTGGSGGNPTAGGGCNAGGGSGGGGGYTIVGYGGPSLPGGVVVTASGGAAGSPVGTGTAGGTGGNGNTSIYILGPT